MSYTPCDSCPEGELEGLPCWAGSNGFKGICAGVCGRKVAEDAPAFRRLVIEKSHGRPAPGPPPAADHPTTETPRPPAKQILFGNKGINIKAIQECPDRGEKIGDGCNCLHVCRKGHGSGFAGEVSLYDCQDCLAGNPRVPAYGKRIT